MNAVGDFVQKNFKACSGGLIAFLGVLAADMSAHGVILGISAGLAAFGLVYAVPNKGMADAQAVVDQVKALVPADARAAIEEVVPAARGVLKTVQ